MSTEKGGAAGAVTMPAWRSIAYVGVVAGLVISVGANVAHAKLSGGGRWAMVFGGTWPVLLFLTLEVLSRTPWPTTGRGVLVARVGGGVVALVAAAFSYWHLYGLLTHLQEEEYLAYIGPLAIDGMMAVSASALLIGQMTPVAVTPAQGVADTGSATPDDKRPAPVGNTRQTIAEHLSHTPATVAELSALTGVSRTAVSGHLTKLGAVKRDGLYRLPVRRAS